MKATVKHKVKLEDRRVAKIVRRCQHIPGYELFQYLDDDGERHSIDSADVNQYLQEISGQDFTAKDFRTWAGTVTACRLLQALDPFDTQTQAKKNVVDTIKSVAAQLGNTPSVCRKCYVHPDVLDLYMNGELQAVLRKRIGRKLTASCRSLQHDERFVMQILNGKSRPTPPKKLRG